MKNLVSIIFNIFLVSIVFIIFISINIFANSRITVDEVLYESAETDIGSNVGEFVWDGNNTITLNSYDGGSIRAEGDLVVILNGDNKITCNDSENYGLSTQNGNLTIEGNGSLTIDALDDAKWSSGICIVVDDEDKTVEMNGVDIIVNAAFCGIEGHIEDFNRNNITGSTFLDIINSNVTLNGTKAIYMCGDKANIKLSGGHFLEPNNGYFVDMNFEGTKNAKVLSDRNDNIVMVGTDYDANSNLIELRDFLTDYNISKNVKIEKSIIGNIATSFTISPRTNIIIISVLIVLLILIIICLFKKKKNIQNTLEEHNKENNIENKDNNVNAENNINTENNSN